MNAIYYGGKRFGASGGDFGMAPAVYDPAGYKTQLQPETDPRLATNDKTIAGAINEIAEAKGLGT